MKNLLLRWPVVLILGLMSCTSAEQRKLGEAKAELALTWAAREKAEYKAAREHAQKAVALAPAMASAHFALGTIADETCDLESARSPNNPECQLAMEEYRRVLQLDGSHLEALKNLAYMLWQFGWDESKSYLNESEGYYRKALALNPNDRDVLASLAGIDDSRSWKEIWPAMAKTAPRRLIDQSACAKLRDANLARLNEGIELMMRASQISPDNSELLFWLRALYSLRAEIQCANRQAYQADILEGEKWGRYAKELSERGIVDHSPRRYPAAPPPPPEK